MALWAGVVRALSQGTFRQISRDALGEETRSYVIEMLVFALVVGLIAWPLISLLIVLSQTARG